MDSDLADLTSVATALDELTGRVSEVADRYNATTRDDVATDLYEVERALRSAHRRLTQAIDQLS